MSRAWRLLAAGIVCALVARPAFAASGTRVVFTVDVESNESFRLPGQIDAVCKEGVACGLTEIVRMLGERRWSGTFFLDVFEHRPWGETAMRDIAVRLQDAGQDVELHTHPHWAYDTPRWAMHQYSVDEQTTIVGDGVRLLHAWTGRPVIAHRAGAYTADEGTLIALQRNGIRLDSSLLWQYPNSRLDTLGLLRNRPSWYGRVAEIPVTVYQREDRPRMFGTALGPTTLVRKIDPNWLIDADETRTAIDAVLAAKVPVLVVFLHSFSFMAAPNGGGPPLADRHAIDMFRVILDQVASHNLPIVTMRELAGEMTMAPSLEADVVPRVTVRVDLLRYFWRRAKGVGRVSLGVGLFIACACAGMLLVLARRRTLAERRASQADAMSRAWMGARSR
jgi:peptidoglycan/xylan/chitin deacetylase (PgdA/CDA1 family)